MITTKLQSIKFYALSISGLLLLGMLGTKLITVVIDPSQNVPAGSKFFMISAGLLMYFIVFSMVCAYWKYSPKITIDNGIISFGKQLFLLDDIKEAALTEKLPFGFLFFTFPMAGAMLRFNDGTKKLLFNAMYSNAWEIKSYLEQTVINKQVYRPIPTRKTNKNAVGLETALIFKGNQFTSMRGLFLWGMVGIIIYDLSDRLQSLPVSVLIALGAFIVVWFTLSSWFMYYFELTKDYLIIRNHIFVWVKEIYWLPDIREVVYETQGRRPNSMRVTTRNFKSKLYPAGTLRNKTWLDLQARLEAGGVAVKNECIPK
jgi:hypothetical protein